MYGIINMSITVIKKKADLLKNFSLCPACHEKIVICSFITTKCTKCGHIFSEYVKHIPRNSFSRLYYHNGIIFSSRGKNIND